MPSITRSNALVTRKKIYIEADTPSIPTIGGKFEKIKRNKRKLAEEFSPHCHVNEKFRLSYERTVSKNSSCKTTGDVTEHNDKEKKVRKTRSKLVHGNKIPRKSEGGKGSKSKAVNNCSNTCESTINVTENIEPGKLEKRDYNQRRVSKAIQDISSDKSGKSDILEVLEENQSEEKISLHVNANEKTSCEEENYEHKYFQLLDMMKELQEKFLGSQKNIEEHVAANDTYLEEMKIALDEKNKELVLAKEELETCRIQNSELDKCKRRYEQEIIYTKVEMTTKSLEDNEAKGRREDLQSKMNDQRDILDFYKLLTGLSLEINDCAKLDDTTFRCVMKTSETEEIKFTLTQDREFAEIEYKPLPCVCEEAKKGYSSLPKYLREQIFFEDELAPKFLLRLLRAVYDREKNGL